MSQVRENLNFGLQPKLKHIYIIVFVSGLLHVQIMVVCHSKLNCEFNSVSKQDAELQFEFKILKV